MTPSGVLGEEAARTEHARRRDHSPVDDPDDGGARDPREGSRIRTDHGASHLGGRSLLSHP